MSVNSFRLKIWQIERTCIFELSWDKGQQLVARLPFLETLPTLYQAWRQDYLHFYSTVRARVEMSGTTTLPPTDWRSRLVQTESKLLAEFHYWLSSAELLEIRKAIARAAAQTDERSTAPVDLFLTCDSLELARLPWETWEIITEFAVMRPIRIARTPANLRAEMQQRHRQGKMRILAILGDDTGLNFQADREAVKSLDKVAEIAFVGWQQGQEIATLKEQIRQAIADPQGWDILFFAGHSNETDLTGGELGIAPNESILMSEIAPQLALAKERGLQFALFNSCNGLSLATALLDLGLSQVAIMREPIHNRVAQEFLVHFLQSIAQYQDVQDAMLSACQALKLERNLTYPSAYLVPSLFRHPDAVPFRLKPFGWKQRLQQWLPTRREAIVLSSLLLAALFVPLQEGLMAQRLLTQARYRNLTRQIPNPPAPVFLIQIDDQTIQMRGINPLERMDRRLLADLVNRSTKLGARVIGMDYLLDSPNSAQDPVLQTAVQNAVRTRQTWFLFAAKRNKAQQWVGVRPEIALHNWSLPGDIWTPYWQIRPVSRSDTRLPPFSYGLATAFRLQHENLNASSIPVPRPNLNNPIHLLTQVRAYTRKVKEPFISERMLLHPITDLSYHICHPWLEQEQPLLCQRWLQPLLDFSLPPSQVYHAVSAKWFLEKSDEVLFAHGLSSLQEAIVIIAPGGYDQAGVTKFGEDNPPLPDAISYWRKQQADLNQGFTGGEVHAYMTHHFLTHHLVVPIPDLWMVLIAALIAKGILLAMATRQFKSTQALLILITATLGYGMVSLQLCLSGALLLPWLLPSTTIWIYLLPTIWRNDHA